MFGKGKKKKGKDDAEASESEGAPAPAPAEGEAAEGEGEGGKKKSKLKMIIIIAVAALLVVGGGGGAAWFFLVKNKPHDAASAEAAAKDKEKKKKDKEKGHGDEKVDEKTMGKVSEGPEGVTYFTMPKMLVNIQSADGRPAVIGMTMTFELSDEEGTVVIRQNMPRVQDMLQTFLRELRPEDLNGSQGSYRVKQEIMRRMNLLIAPAKINAINMEEFVVQ